MSEHKASYAPHVPRYKQVVLNAVAPLYDAILEEWAQLNLRLIKQNPQAQQIAVSDYLLLLLEAAANNERAQREHALAEEAKAAEGERLVQPATHIPKEMVEASKRLQAMKAGA